MLGSKLPLDIANADENWSYLEVGISGGVSRVLESKSVAPIRLLNPRTQSSSCRVLVSNYGGGMVAGDRVCLNVTCRESARLNIGSVGNLQIYRSPAKRCSQVVKARLESNALCVCNPDPVVLHFGSRFAQKQHWEAHRESSLLVMECVIAGRLKTGEHFDFSEYVSEFTVVMDGHPLIVERFEFRPGQLNFQDPALFSGLACLLNLYMVGNKWAALADLLSEELDRCCDSDPRTLAAIYPVQQKGYILRTLSEDRRRLAWIADAIAEFVSSDDCLGFNPLERKY
jgi:urease accessory protein